MKSLSTQRREKGRGPNGQAFIELLLALAVFLPLVLGLGALLRAQERRLLCIAHELSLLKPQRNCPQMNLHIAPLQEWHRLLESENVRK